MRKGFSPDYDRHGKHPTCTVVPTGLFKELSLSFAASAFRHTTMKLLIFCVRVPASASTVGRGAWHLDRQMVRSKVPSNGLFGFGRPGVFYASDVRGVVDASDVANIKAFLEMSPFSPVSPRWSVGWGSFQRDE